MKKYTVRELHDGAIKNITTDGGIYFLKMPSNFEIKVKEKNDGRQCTSKGKPSEYPVERLEKKVKLVYGCDPRQYSTDIIYIGQTNHSVGLQQRLIEYLGFRYDDETIKKPHDGGRAAWQIENNENLIVEVEPADKQLTKEEIEEKERHYIKEFKEKYHNYPLANQRL